MALPNPDKNIFKICQCCNGVGIISGGSNRPSVACSNCHGSGKYKYLVTKEICQICGGSKVDDKVSRLCLCHLDKKEGMINHPKHYTFGTIEVIEVIDDWQLRFYEGQVIKYVGRAKHKGNELEDLKKAQWYLNRLIKNMELDIAAEDDK